MIRVIGCILVVAASTFAGYSAYKQLKLRAATVSALISVLMTLSNEVVSKMSPLAAAVRTAQRTAPIETLPFLEALHKNLEQNGGAAFGDSWLLAAQTLPTQESAAISELASVLGRYGAEEQQTAINLAIERLKRVGQQAEEDAQKSGKVYITLGACAGLAIAVILI